MEETNMTVHEDVVDWVSEAWARACAEAYQAQAEFSRALRDESAQGTTEYAILVGVLVVIAILAIVAFRDNVQSLWDDIEEGINSL